MWQDIGLCNKLFHMFKSRQRDEKELFMIIWRIHILFFLAIMHQQWVEDPHAVSRQPRTRYDVTNIFLDVTLHCRFVMLLQTVFYTAGLGFLLRMESFLIRNTHAHTDKPYRCVYDNITHATHWKGKKNYISLPWWDLIPWSVCIKLVYLKWKQGLSDTCSNQLRSAWWANTVSFFCGIWKNHTRV